MERKVMLVIKSSYPVSEKEMDKMVLNVEYRANDSASVYCYIAPLPENTQNEFVEVKRLHTSLNMYKY